MAPARAVGADALAPVPAADTPAPAAAAGDALAPAPAADAMAPARAAGADALAPAPAADTPAPAQAAADGPAQAAGAGTPDPAQGAGADALAPAPAAGTPAPAAAAGAKRSAATVPVAGSCAVGAVPGPTASGAPHARASGSRATAAPIHGTPPDALVTTGGTESNQLALLLAREAHPGARLIHGANAHHSLSRAAWLLGLPDPVVVPAPAGILDPVALDEALTRLPGPHLVAATAGTTDAGLIDPLAEIARITAAHHARLHIDAAYGGGLLFSDRHRHKLAGLDAAATVTLDLHKLGWQPVAAGLLVVRDPHDLTALHQHADYLNADDDTEAGLPDLLARSLRTTRRPDILKIAVTLKTLGRKGMGRLVDQVCEQASEFADLVDKHPGFELYDRPTISTVVFRPTKATDDTVAAVRRKLLTEGRAVIGRARLDGRLWLKVTLLNPHTRQDDLAALLNLVEGTTPR
ncbi:pyridoxal phosphate-dependent decarboxylase family protein [Streptomyces cupreus]|uniref:Aspartate aminotransferase family protein n=1 Tax=Streptomyces cupreus TaxID=2759956 RepID=A0A7X1J9Z6_9ACTN|nr:aminotransferase class V-fold PLP-dependent enzyme [Streptomyces cupreus]MBC2905852.1 aspartate aminotransferase family protein [Streptomyces cupreus]